MSNWYMLTVVGKDRAGIVAQVTGALYEGGCNLGEASMIRLGGNFTIMLMVQHDGGADGLNRLLAPVMEPMALHMHIDRIEGHLHEHVVPDVRISVFGADQPGIVAKITRALSEAGLNILNLESDVGGTADRPIYVMHIEGQAGMGLDVLRAALKLVTQDGIQAMLTPIDTLVG